MSTKPRRPARKKKPTVRGLLREMAQMAKIHEGEEAELRDANAELRARLNDAMTESKQYKSRLDAEKEGTSHLIDEIERLISTNARLTGYLDGIHDMLRREQGEPMPEPEGPTRPDMNPPGEAWGESIFAHHNRRDRPRRWHEY